MLCKCGGKLKVKDSSMKDFIDYVLVTRKRRCLSCGMLYKTSEKVYGAKIKNDYTHGNERGDKE